MDFLRPAGREEALADKAQSPPVATIAGGRPEILTGILQDGAVREP
ncbi:hypothetical protein [Streptomyces sp. NPDC096339]